VTATDVPKVTVVTPSFNQAEFIEQCITSVLGQGYPALEYIVIDGGSTDGTVELIRTHERDISHWASESDRGQTHALNKGLRRATGDIVGWLNADDYYLPGALQTAAEAYRSHPHASFYFGDGLRVDRAGKPVRPFFRDGFVAWNRRSFAHGLNYVLQPAAFINRQHLQTAGYLDESLHWGFDTDLWIRLAEISEPVPMRSLIAASREYGETKTASGGFERAEELRRIAQRHTGLPLTPGALGYYLGTLYGLVEDRPDVYPAEFRQALDRFFDATTGLFAAYGAGKDGFPADEPPTEPARVASGSRQTASTSRLLRRRVRGIAGQTLRRVGLR
jgi:glycosyltransferase involved in cell wall biosynthesis